MSHKLSDGQRHCKQCKVIKDAKRDFTQTFKRGCDIVFCDQCAFDNMKRWARTPTSKLTDLSQIKAIDV